MCIKSKVSIVASEVKLREERANGLKKGDCMGGEEWCLGEAVDSYG